MSGRKARFIPGFFGLPIGEHEIVLPSLVSNKMATADPYPRAYLYRRIVQAKLYIDRHYHEKIDLDLIASEARFSKFHFIRLFKNAYRLTPHSYLTQIRIEKARKLLEETDNSIAEVGFMVGFESLGSFSTLFKRKTGLSPAAYRKHQVKRFQLSQEQPLTFIPGCFGLKMVD